MAIHEWEYYAQCSRLRTKREKKRLQKTNRDKKLIQLYRKLSNIQDEQHNLGYKELMPPVQRGWKRSFVLRPSLKGTAKGDFLECLLKKINRTEYSHRKDFKKTEKRKGKKVQVAKIQMLKTISEMNFRDFKNLSQREMAYFKKIIRLRGLGNGRVGEYTDYVFENLEYFTLKVEANIINKVRIISPLLLQQEAEIDNYFKNRGLYPKVWKLRKGSCYNHNRWKPQEKEKYKYVLKPTFIKNEIDEYYKDKQKNEQ